MMAYAQAMPTETLRAKMASDIIKLVYAPIHMEEQIPKVAMPTLCTGNKETTRSENQAR